RVAAAPEKRLEDARLVARGEARPLVLHGELDLLALPLDDERRGGLRVPLRVLEEVRDGAHAEGRIAREGPGAATHVVDGPVDVRLLEGPPREVDGVDGDRREGREVDPRAREELRDEGVDLHHLFVDLVEGGLLAALRAGELREQ